MPFFLRLREAHSSVPHSQVCSQPPPPAPAATPRCPATAPEAAAGAAGASTGRMKHRRHFQPSAAARRQNAEGLRAASGGNTAQLGPVRPGTASPCGQAAAPPAGGSGPGASRRSRCRWAAGQGALRLSPWPPVRCLCAGKGMPKCRAVEREGRPPPSAGPRPQPARRLRLPWARSVRGAGGGVRRARGRDSERPSRRVPPLWVRPKPWASRHGGPLPELRGCWSSGVVKESEVGAFNFFFLV